MYTLCCILPTSRVRVWIFRNCTGGGEPDTPALPDWESLRGAPPARSISAAAPSSLLARHQDVPRQYHAGKRQGHAESGRNCIKQYDLAPKLGLLMAPVLPGTLRPFFRPYRGA